MQETKVKAYNTKQLAQLYNVSRDTFRNWIKPFKPQIGTRIGDLYTPKQVQAIFDALGEP